MSKNPPELAPNLQIPQLPPMTMEIEGKIELVCLVWRNPRGEIIHREVRLASAGTAHPDVFNDQTPEGALSLQNWFLMAAQQAGGLAVEIARKPAEEAGPEAPPHIPIYPAGVMPRR